MKDHDASIREKVSVCLLTYNHAHLIESTLESILDQTITGYEVVVSDDCSTDGTWELLQKLASRDSRIRVVRTPQNVGMAGNGNYAVAQTARPYIALLHHDDIYRSDLLEEWVELLDRYPGMAFVFNAYGVYQSDFVYREDVVNGCMEGPWLLEQFLLPHWGCVVRGTAMIRRSAWEEVGGLRRQFGLLADIDLWMRLSMHWQVGYIDEPLILVRQERPEEYPVEYKGGSWSWRRQRFLYEIHAANRLEYYDLGTLGGRLCWLYFRLRLSVETAKWLTYALVRKKSDMIESSKDCVTPYDLLPLRLYRWVIQAITLTNNR
jgi:glycosyltransferase involved in cell wall biosynthesis